MISYPVALWGERALRRRNSTSSQTLPSWFWFTEWTVAWAVWFGPQVPVSRAVESSYFWGSGLDPPIWVPKANPGFVRTLAQSRPSVWPLVHWPRSEMGFSARGKLVLWVPCVHVGAVAAGSMFVLRVASGQTHSTTTSASANDRKTSLRFAPLKPIREY